MKTLYISDLDGTMLDKRAVLTPRAKVILTELLQDNANITCATARSLASVAPILNGLKFQLPLVLMNGVCIYDTQQKKYIRRETIAPEAAMQIAALLDTYQLPAFLYRIDDTAMDCYHPKLCTESMTQFMEERKERYNKPFIEVPSLRDAVDENTVYITMVRRREEIEPFYNAAKQIPGLQLAYYKDVYSEDDWYLEICGENASKFHAVNFLREYGGFDQVIGFGDNMNDLPMFDACDACYAVSNAQKAVRERADGVIGSNEQDAVPTWIYNHFYHIIISEGANWL
ncbi:MAG: HAD-IIB family hydrolase [Ruminococcus sp.]|nr:HAD-IIB family hydrolase [Ruminococcus sp.]